ncbi:MAG: cupin domain-containing protein [Anaerolineae bacterium]|jgi:mannose-6-phosphate isomerase-like protein (cupin superfamily)
MIVQANDIEVVNGRRPYPLGGLKVEVEHFVVRITTPENPFRPHAHEQPELWFVVKGEGEVTLHGAPHAVTAGDLILIEPWLEHGLHTTTRVEWICLG